MRRHDWIFDVLSDLRDYALENDLSDLAASVGAAIVVARRESLDPDSAADQRQGRHGRTH